MVTTERKENAAISWLKNAKSSRKPYEDRYRLLSRDIPLVGNARRGEIFAVLDGIGGAEMGMAAAQAVADCLIDFYRQPEKIAANSQGLAALLMTCNMTINSWGVIPGTDRPLGGAAGTIAWLHDQRLTLFHAGDTAGILIRVDQPPRTLTSLHEFDGGIFRYFGLGERLQIEVLSERVEEGDLILLVSDGVTKVFSTTEAAKLVLDIHDQCGDLGRAAQELVVRSRSKGATDDITALVVEITES